MKNPLRAKIPGVYLRCFFIQMKKYTPGTNPRSAFHIFFVGNPLALAPHPSAILVYPLAPGVVDEVPQADCLIAKVDGPG